MKINLTAFVLDSIGEIHTSRSKNLGVFLSKESFSSGFLISERGELDTRSLEDALSWLVGSNPWPSTEYSNSGRYAEVSLKT
jgi:hypothetical protein